MSAIQWELHGREFANCNCSYGCPCQFNALPTYGSCWAVIGVQIDRGFHGDTPLDGLRVAGIFKYPQAIHLGNGEGLPIVDQRANEAQRNALLRIMSGQDTRPGATMFQVFASMLSKVYDPVFADIDFGVDIAKRRAEEPLMFLACYPEPYLRNQIAERLRWRQCIAVTVEDGTHFAVQNPQRRYIVDQMVLQLEQ